MQSSLSLQVNIMKQFYNSVKILRKSYYICIADFNHNKQFWYLSEYTIYISWRIAELRWVTSIKETISESCGSQTKLTTAFRICDLICCRHQVDIDALAQMAVENLCSAVLPSTLSLQALSAIGSLPTVINRREAFCSLNHCSRLSISCSFYVQPKLIFISLTKGQTT